MCIKGAGRVIILSTFKMTSKSKKGKDVLSQEKDLVTEPELHWSGVLGVFLPTHSQQPIWSGMAQVLPSVPFVVVGEELTTFLPALIL